MKKLPCSSLHNGSDFLDNKTTKQKQPRTVYIKFLEQTAG